MKFLFVLAQLGAAIVREDKEARRKMPYANFAVFAAVLFTTLIENLGLCFSAQAGNVLNLF